MTRRLRVNGAQKLKRQWIGIDIPPSRYFVDHVREREGAAIALLISLDGPSKGMLADAANAGLYMSVKGKLKVPRVQLLTMADYSTARSARSIPIKSRARISNRPRKRRRTNSNR